MLKKSTFTELKEKTQNMYFLKSLFCFVFNAQFHCCCVPTHLIKAEFTVKIISSVSASFAETAIKNLFVG